MNTATTATTNLSPAIQRFDPLLFMPDSHGVNEAIGHVIPHLDTGSLAQCAKVNRHFNRECNKAIWRAPSFQDGYLYNPLRLLNRFIDLLPVLRPETQALVTVLDLSHIEESLYESVRPHFFDALTRYTPNLQVLKMVKTSFLTLSSVRGTGRLEYLRALDLSYCEHISDDLLVELAPRVPRLAYLRLDSLGSDAGGERGLAAFADHCDSLESVSIRYNDTITNGALTALAKFGKIHVKEVDLTGCAYVTPIGLAAMARFNINLQYLSLAKTACDVNHAIAFLTGRSARYLRHLDLGFCASLDDPMAADRIASVLWNEAERPAPSLECLAISLSVAKAMLGRGPCPCPILFLVVHGLHQDTPMQLLTALLASFPSARQIAFTRDEPEDEYMSFYSDVPDPSTSRHYINQDTIKQFNLCQNNVLVTLTNDREKIDGLTMHHW
ncbi:hypothetical protein LRAMOSA07537 [Lichtheimia ramosa]|uniref:F-box domain-containing protein n=1 Tax=Lichtheimia ramosa TaxID=688394 RepID=A0A077WEL5_9FUNG|nr:hypothetical protein LRAMOSA07537 [Lichtheimia ramosa]